jgi:flagellin-like hook-associated protein FlgL
LSETERLELQQEVDERLEKILDIQNKTTFNGIKVLGEASQTSQIMNVHIGTSSAAGMTTFDSYYNVGSLSVDLSSSESSTNAIENLDDLIQLADVKINQMNYQNEKYVNSVTEHATDILELNDSIKAMIGTNETVENAKLSNAQTLQDTCQYLISQLANINKDVITTLLPKSYSYSK